MTDNNNNNPSDNKNSDNNKSNKKKGKNNVQRPTFIAIKPLVLSNSTGSPQNKKPTSPSTNVKCQQQTGPQKQQQQQQLQKTLQFIPTGTNFHSSAEISKSNNSNIQLKRQQPHQLQQINQKPPHQHEQQRSIATKVIRHDKGKRSRACNNCRKSKIRCEKYDENDDDDDDKPCKKCFLNGLQCIFEYKIPSYKIVGNGHDRNVFINNTLKDPSNNTSNNEHSNNNGGKTINSVNTSTNSSILPPTINNNSSHNNNNNRNNKTDNNNNDNNNEANNSITANNHISNYVLQNSTSGDGYNNNKKLLQNSSSISNLLNPIPNRSNYTSSYNNQHPRDEQHNFNTLMRTNDNNNWENSVENRLATFDSKLGSILNILVQNSNNNQQQYSSYQQQQQQHQQNFNNQSQSASDYMQGQREQQQLQYHSNGVANWTSSSSSTTPTNEYPSQFNSNLDFNNSNHQTRNHNTNNQQKRIQQGDDSEEEPTNKRRKSADSQTRESSPHASYSDIVTLDDVLSKDDAKELFKYFDCNISSQLFGFTISHYSVDDIWDNCPILVATICSIASIHHPFLSNLSTKLETIVHRLSQEILFTPPENEIQGFNTVVALCFCGFWFQQKQMFTGLALQLASKMRLNDVKAYERNINSNKNGISSKDRLKLWYLLYILDGQQSMVFNRQPMIQRKNDKAIINSRQLLLGDSTNAIPNETKKIQTINYNNLEDEAVNTDNKNKENTSGTIPTTSTSEVKIPKFSDLRLVSQIEYNEAINSVFSGDAWDLLVPASFGVPFKTNLELDKWMVQWTVLLSPFNKGSVWSSKSTLIYYNFAKMHINSSAVRQLNITGEDFPKFNKDDISFIDSQNDDAQIESDDRSLKLGYDFEHEENNFYEQTHHHHHHHNRSTHNGENRLASQQVPVTGKKVIEELEVPTDRRSDKDEYDDVDSDGDDVDDDDDDDDDNDNDEGSLFQELSPTQSRKVSSELAISGAKTVLNLVLDDNDIIAALKYVPIHIHLMLYYAVLLVLNPPEYISRDIPGKSFEDGLNTIKKVKKLRHLLMSNSPVDKNFAKKLNEGITCLLHERVKTLRKEIESLVNAKELSERLDLELNNNDSSYFIKNKKVQKFVAWPGYDHGHPSNSLNNINNFGK
ncbi:binding protein [[Candida] boidinii]|nr:binding protein [[Candida] boidinii]